MSYWVATTAARGRRPDRGLGLQDGDAFVHIALHSEDIFATGGGWCRAWASGGHAGEAADDQ